MEFVSFEVQCLCLNIWKWMLMLNREWFEYLKMNVKNNNRIVEL